MICGRRDTGEHARAPAERGGQAGPADADAGRAAGGASGLSLPEGYLAGQLALEDGVGVPRDDAEQQHQGDDDQHAAREVPRVEHPQLPPRRRLRRRVKPKADPRHKPHALLPIRPPPPQTPGSLAGYT